MERILFDTDILSVFAKVESLSLLRKIFPEADFLIVEEVFDELKYAEENGFSFPEKVFEVTEKMTLDERELGVYSELQDRRNFTALSRADFKTFVVADQRGLVLVSNDSHLVEVADQEDVVALDIYDVLRLIYLRDVLSRDQILDLVESMEAEDNLKLPDLDSVFSTS